MRRDYLQLCEKGFKASHNTLCPFVYGTHEYQAWSLGYWMWITGLPKPTELKHVSDCLWVVNGKEVQWLGCENNERKKEFITHN